MQITEHNAVTNETIVRDMTDAEIEQYEKDQLQNESFAEAEESKKLNRLAVLNRLGLTEEEAKLLLG